MAGLTLSAGQWAILGAVWVLAFALPAVWMARKARRDEDPDVFVWVALVAVGSVLGVLEYYHHRSILKRRARRAARQAAAAGQDEPPKP